MSDHDHHHSCKKRTFWDRRDFLFQSGGGIAGLALAHLMDKQGLLAAAQSDTCEVPVPGNPFTPRDPHFEPRAKSVISLFMSGGVSQVDTFDPKQALIDHAGEPVSSARYDRDGETDLRSGHFDAEGKLQTEHLFQHDADGRVLVDTTLDAAWRERSESRYSYDNQGRRTEWQLLGGGRQLLGRSVYRYEGGQLVEV